MYKRILSFLIILSIFLAMSCPVFADYTSSNYTLADIWLANWKNATADNWLNSSWFSNVSSSVGDGSICALSDDGLHHTSNYQPSLGSGSDARGYFAYCQCDYCGQMFKCYSEDFSNAYDDHVAGMPATNYNSVGQLVFTAEHKYTTIGNARCLHHSSPQSPYYGAASIFLDCSGASASFYLYPGINQTSFSGGSDIRWYSYWIFNCPVDGIYTTLSTPQLIMYCTDTSGVTTTKTARTYIDGFQAAGTVLEKYIYTFPSSGPFVSIEGTINAPQYAVTPAASSTTTNYYVNASRPTYNITYNLATVTQAGDYTVINNVYENQTIINEGDNIFIDPDTGNEYEIEGWEFDYTNRKYTCNLVDGSLLEVTFGDAYVTVELNGEVEYYYYATEDESGDEVTGGDTDCTHEFVLADSLEPTCTTGGYDVYACKLCGATQEESYFATGHDYQFLWTVLDTYEVDTSTLVCPGCNGTDITCTQVDNTENFTCVCNSADCAQTWTVVGSTIAGYDLYQCINCQEFYNDYTHEGVDRSDAGYWSWLQTWLQNFKTWLGEKLDALINKEVSVGGGDTINNEEVNNFYDQSDTNINTDADIDYAISYTDEDGTEQETSLKGIIAKFAFIKDIWKIGQTLISVVSEDAAYAYEFDPTIGNEATTDTGEEVAAASVTEEADTLLSSNSGAPSIPLNLGAAQSVYGFNYGGEVEMLDLSWYTPYKETVDKLVGGFLWLFFMWKLFQKAPGILSGASMDSSKAEDIKSGTKGKRR